MKKQFLLLTLATTVTLTFVIKAQNRINRQTQSVSINDIRKLGVTSYDTSTIGHKPGEVIVDRAWHEIQRTEAAGNEKMDMYQIHFFKISENKLRNYQVAWGAVKDYDKASYTWLADTVVSVTLINSSTGQTKNIKIAQTNLKKYTAVILKESWE